MSKFFTRLGAEIAKLFNESANEGERRRIIGFRRSNLLAEAKNVTDDPKIQDLVEKRDKQRNRNKRTQLDNQIAQLMDIRKREEDARGRIPKSIGNTMTRLIDR